jgi:CxxC motif-containing protein (DUF1111 family)
LTLNCQCATVPNDVTTSVRQIGAIENFANFQRFLAPPQPSLTRRAGPLPLAAADSSSRASGCVYCHTPTLRTGHATVAALRDKAVHLFSDLGLHRMGPGLADDIVQGEASPDEFRTAPLGGSASGSSTSTTVALPT